ncbi:MAG: OmpL47-type beta-barrel domain-containing protein, partial [Promethearchaeota archaeon]
IGYQQIDYLPYDGRKDVTFQYAFGPGAHEIYVVIDGSESIEELDKTNNIAYNIITILPDLSVSSTDITFSNNTPAAGDEITISAIICNQGGTSAENVKVGFFSNDNPIGEDTVSLVNPGEYETASVSWTAAAGYNNITAVVDPANSIQEWNETNNHATTSISILPDLHVEPIFLSNNDLFTGQSLQISTEIVNLGAADANGVLAELFDGNPFAGGNVIHSQNLDVLPLGEKSSFVFEWTPPPGIHQVFVIVDRENLIAECNESNNMRYQELVVRTLPDLSISESDIIYESGSIKIVVPVKNEGKAGAAGVIVGLYDGKSVEGGEMICSDTIFHISPGQASSVELVLYEPPETGCLYLVVDPEEAIEESDEANNGVVVNYVDIPRIDAGSDQVVDEGTMVDFTGSAVVPGNIEDYNILWDFGDGSTDSESLTLTHTYGDSRVYVVTLTVSGTSYSGVDHMQVTVQNLAPTVDAGPDITADEGTSLIFAGDFNDPGWLDTHTIQWDFGDGSTAGGSLTPPHTYADDGTYCVLLTVTDDDGGVGTDSLVVMVQNVAPVAQAGPDRTIDEDQETTFDASGSSDAPSDQPLLAYTWDFGDGSSGTGLIVSHVYSDPGTYVVTLTVTDDDGGIGTDLCIVDVLDRTAPVTTIDIEGIPGLNGWYVSDVVVTLEANDAASDVSHTYYRINGGAWIEYPGAFLLSVTGEYEIECYSIDSPGNVEEALPPTMVKVDKDAPETTARMQGTQGSEGWYIGEVEVTLEYDDSAVGSGVLNTRYSFDGIVWYDYTGPFVVNIEGTHTISFYSVDVAGNAEGEKGEELKIDTMAPETSIAFSGTPGLDGWYVSDVVVTLTPDDADIGSGILFTYYSIDAGDLFEYTGPFLVDEDEIHTISFYSVDVAGNTEVTKHESLKIDTDDPFSTLQISPSLGDNPTYITSSTEFTIVSDDGLSGVAHRYYSINGDGWSEYLDPFTLDGPDGEYTISYYSVDFAGNDEDPKQKTVYLTSLHVDSHTADGDGNLIDFFETVFTKDRHSGGYKLVATNPGQIFYHLCVTNCWPIDVDMMTIEIGIPEDFVTKGANPIHVYLDGADITPLSLIADCSVIVTDIPADSMIEIVVHLDYALKGNVYESPAAFGMRSYKFSTAVEGNSMVLVGTYESSTILAASQKKTTAIAGYVLDLNGNPIFGATVDLYDVLGNHMGSVLTDECGFYYFIDIAEGLYIVQVTYDATILSQEVGAVKNELTLVDFNLG